MGWAQMSNTANCLDCGTATRDTSGVLYIGLGQCKMVTRKEWAKSVIREQPYFAVHYDPKAEAMLELNRRLRKLYR